MEVTDPAQIGPWLREARQRRGLSLEDVCQTLGMSKSQLSAIETGRKIPLLPVLLRLTSFYGARLKLHNAPKSHPTPPIVRRGREAAVQGTVIYPTPAQTRILRALAEGATLEQREERDSSGTRLRWWLISTSESPAPVRPHIPLILQERRWVKDGEITDAGRQAIAPLVEG